MFKSFINTEKKKGFLYALYFSVSIAMLFNPVLSAFTSVTGFKRMIGQAEMYGISVDKRVNNFTLWFIILAIAFFAFFILFNRFFKDEKDGEQKKVQSFLDNFVVFADMALLVRSIGFFADSESMGGAFSYVTVLVTSIMIIAFLYIILELDTKISALDFLKCEIVAFSVGFPIAIILQIDWRNGKLLALIQLILMAIIPFLIKVLPINALNNNMLTAAAIATAFIPLITSFYIEGINILNQYGVFVGSPRRAYLIPLLVIVVAAVVLFFVLNRIKTTVNKKSISSDEASGSTGATSELTDSRWKTLCYAALAVGISFMNVQLPLENVFSVDIFESANWAVPISDFLRFGDIPIAEHYGGHMMTGVWEGILYGIINNDAEGAVLSPYSVILRPLLVLLAFLLIRKIWNEEMAFFIALFYPFYLSWNNYALCGLVILAIWLYMKKNTYPRAALIWLAFIWCALYRLDIGFSVLLGTFAALAVYIIINKNRKAILQLAVTLVAWAVAGLSAWTVICVKNGISPIERLKEFLLISASNQNWARASLGDTSSLLFAWCYIILPFIMVICLVYLIVSKKMKENAGEKLWIAMIMLGFMYFGNYSRGLVKHSLEEMALHIIIWDAYIFIAVFASVYKDKRFFLPVLGLLMIFTNAMAGNVIYGYTSLGEEAVAKVGDITGTWTLNKSDYANAEPGTEVLTYWEQIKRDGRVAKRFDISDETKEMLEPYRAVTDTLLGEGETYLDFMNRSSFYAFLGRRAPVYVSQSPSQLSGEYTQEMFIKEMSGVPIVIMPLTTDRLAAAMDDIANVYRYYKVSEYIYDNYRPLCKYDGYFAVWCLKDRYDEMYAKAEVLMADEQAADNNASGFSYADYGYDESASSVDQNGDMVPAYDNGFHVYNVGLIPYLWAEYDDVAGGEVISEASLSRGLYEFYVDDDQRTVAGNYLLIEGDYTRAEVSGTANGMSESVADTANELLRLGVYEDGTFVEKYRYTFTPEQGTHKYLIRVSCDYEWYSSNVNAVKLGNDNSFTVNSVSVINGDGVVCY